MNSTMGTLKTAVFLAVLASSPLAMAQSDYLGVLKPPRASLPVSGGTFYSSFENPFFAGLAPSLDTTGGFKFKLGYKYSPYFAVESGYVDYGRNGQSPFTGPGNLSSAFRTKGFGVDTIGSIPFWNKFSFYGRLGAFRADAQPALASPGGYDRPGITGTRVHYGLGLRYDFNRSFGVRAEVERYSAFNANPFGEGDADLVSVGVQWRF
jgi:OmpA-OmpF porin, OOP family